LGKAWFEEASRPLDPGLVHQLRKRRKRGGDGRDEAVPVIIRFKREAEEEKRKDVLRRCRKRSCDSIGGEIRLLNGCYGRLHPDTIRDLTDHEGVFRIYYDREVHAFLDVASKTTRSFEVHDRLGFTGKGVTIAVIDTGIHPHGDLTKPDNRIIAFADLVGNREEAYDDHGHGTHCAGDAAGGGYHSEGLYVGPAPEANLVGVKVLDAEGGGRLSTVIRGVEWCVEHKEELGIRILSLSLGAPAYESYRDDPLCQAVERAWHSGLVVCAAAGNEGPEPLTISTPGIDPVILTVGAADDRNTPDRSDDEKAPFSSRGPTIDQLVKPDVYAPGADIVSLSAPGSTLEELLPENRVGEHYIHLSGTSMATPICAGVVALMLEANPYLSPNDVKSILMSTAQPMAGDQAGYLDARKAVDMARAYLEFQRPKVSGGATG
jgi:serine protease AprX